MCVNVNLCYLVQLPHGFLLSHILEENLLGQELNNVQFNSDYYWWLLEPLAV